MVKIYFILILNIVSFFAFAQVDTSNYMVTYVEIPPKYDGDLKCFIKNKLKYPKTAVKDSIQGVVHVSFWIDTLGMTKQHKILKGIRKDLNEEAIRVSKLIKYKIPAMQKGKPIEVRFVVPIHFYLNNKKKRKK